MGSKRILYFKSILQAFVMSLLIIGIIGIYGKCVTVYAVPDVSVTVNVGDTFTTVLDNAAVAFYGVGKTRLDIVSLKITTNGYSLSSSDFTTTLKAMTNSATGNLTYLDLEDAVCSGNAIPSNAFYTSGQTMLLQTFVFPTSITSIGNMHFMDVAD